MIKRYYQNLGKYLERGKVLVVYGARQVGKTTLVKSFLKDCKYEYRFDTGDNLRLQQTISSLNFDDLDEYIGKNKLLVIDEAQKIPNIGQALKIIVDRHPNIYVIVTGSSSFELAGQVGEPLTGRKRTLTLFPISQIELQNHIENYETKINLENYLIYGTYPAVVTSRTKESKKILLDEIVDSYLLRDILELDKVKASKALLDLLRLIAFQVGSEVSTTKLASKIGIDFKTVMRYLDLFEKSFILYNLRGFSRNLREEVTKKSKYYFYDNGVRNAIISNFNKLDHRDDIGQLWENFLVIERLKKQKYQNIFSNNYFWRTWEQKEIDWIEERDGKLFGYEFKWNDNKNPIVPKDWIEKYNNSSYDVINHQNYLDFVGE